VYRMSDRGRPIFVGEPILLSLLAAVALWLGLSRGVPLLVVLGGVVALLAALSILGWSTARRS